MKTANPKIEQALIDVRKAYRLLHDYQRAALDAAKYISTQLGFTYEGGYPLFSDCAPRAGKGALECWSWDWLNLVFYDFNFTRKVGAEEWCFTMRLFSDTGYFVSDHSQPDKSDVSTYAPAEDSQTMVGFIFYQEWKGEYDSFLNSRSDVKRFVDTGSDLPVAFKDGGVFGKCCSFARISDEDSSDALISELVELAKSHGYPVERVRKAV